MHIRETKPLGGPAAAAAVGTAGVRSLRPLMTALLLSIAVLFSPLMAGAQDNGEDRVEVNPHSNRGKKHCVQCHQGETARLNFDPVTTCTKCHQGNIGNHPVARHPIGKAPRINLPAFLPTTKDGIMVCYTCHDPHNRSGHPKMLRVQYLMLCASCHVGY